MKKALLLWLVVCASCALAQSPDKPAVKDCDDLRILYTSMDPKFAARMVAEDTDEARPSGSIRTSPQHTRWILPGSPDYSKAGPWTTSIWIGEGDDSTTVKLTLHDHEGFSIEWLNEKLVYGTVSWSKALNTVFIFDVENKKFLYREMENSSEMAQACD
jgi:hypothetical protein